MKSWLGFIFHFGAYFHRNLVVFTKLGRSVSSAILPAPSAFEQAFLSLSPSPSLFVIISRAPGATAHAHTKSTG